MQDLISRQAAIDVLHGYFDGMLETDAVCPADIYGLFECIPSAQPERWIPCSERLPEEKREVLVSTKDGYLNIAFLETLSTGDFEWTDVIEYFQIPNVTAWMPLPEPYAERRTDESNVQDR